jgi:hypothetical protein
MTNICSKNIYLLFLTLIIIYLLYKDFNKKEDFDATSDTKTLINQVYNADIEAIRNLSSIATTLTTNGGLVVPGSLKVASKLATNNLDPNNMPDGWGGGLRIFDGYASGTMGFGPDGKALKAYINSGGDALVSGTLTSGTNNITGNLSVGGKLILSNNTQLSADGDDATHWLRLQQANNPGQYKSFAAQDLWCAQGTLSSGTINNGGNATINGGLRFGGGIGAYMVDGGCCSFPIFSSIANYGPFGMNDRDDYYILLPGYKILLYTGYNYLNDNNDNGNNPFNSWDNTVGFTSIFCGMNNHVNQTSSCRLYYLGNEVKIGGIS